MKQTKYKFILCIFNILLNFFKTVQKLGSLVKKQAIELISLHITDIQPYIALYFYILITLPIKKLRLINKLHEKYSFWFQHLNDDIFNYDNMAFIFP
jgi:hypothetical protein